MHSRATVTAVFRSLMLAFLLIALLRLGQLWLAETRRRALRRRAFFRAPLSRAAFRRCERAAVGLGFCLGLAGLRGMAFGLGGLVLLPLLAEVGVRLRGQRAREEMEASGIVYFQALRGLIHAGLGLPAALFHLAQVQPSPFARTIARALAGFHEGEGLGECLRRFDRRVPLRLMGTSLTALQLAYRQGIPVAPLLDRMVPWLEREREAELRLRDGRRAAMAQAGVALGVPWIVVGTLWLCQPGLATGLSPWAMVVAGAVEGMGVACLVHTSRFC